MDEYEGPPQHLLLQRTYDAYNETGLTRDECYCDRTTHEIPLSSIIKKKGVLTGDLKLRFYDWFDPK